MVLVAVDRLAAGIREDHSTVCKSYTMFCLYTHYSSTITLFIFMTASYSYIVQLSLTFTQHRPYMYRPPHLRSSTLPLIGHSLHDSGFDDRCPQATFCLVEKHTVGSMLKLWHTFY